jgi:hypothetical protein
MANKTDPDFLVYFFESNKSAMITAMNPRAIVWLQAQDTTMDIDCYTDIEYDEGEDYLKMMQLDNYTYTEYRNG